MLLAYPIGRAMLCVFGPGAADAALPGAYCDGTLLRWQLGVSAAVLAWTCAEGVIRAVRRILHPFGPERS